jgi:hypothetical protein
MKGDDQPFVDHWPTWDEPLSKITAGIDIEVAREKLARRFNKRPVRFSKEIEIEHAWQEHTCAGTHLRRDITFTQRKFRGFKTFSGVAARGRGFHVMVELDAPIIDGGTEDK